MSPNPWFRMYSEFASDPKVQSLSEALQRRLTMLFCFQCSHTLLTLRDEEIAFAMRITDEQLVETKRVFIAKGFIDEGWILLNWDKRQFVSDKSTERTRAYRERLRTSRERHCDGVDTDTDTESDKETDTEAEIKQTPLCASANAVSPERNDESPVREVLDAVEKLKAPRQPKVGKVTNIAGGTRISVETLPDDWAQWALADCGMDLKQSMRVFAEFRDYWLSVPGAKGRKSEWFATWRNRCRNLPLSRDGTKSGSFNFQPQESHTERAIRIGHERIRETGRL